MNPFDFFYAELTADGSDKDYECALRFLLPFWGDEYDDDPTGSVNGWYLIRDKVAALPDCPLKEKMLTHVTDMADRRVMECDAIDY